MSNYRWWTCSSFLFGPLDSTPHGIKVGPLTVFTYRWCDGRWRLSWTFLGGREHIVLGGELV